MLPIDADPILFEVHQLSTQARRVRKALAASGPQELPHPELVEELRALQRRRDALWEDPEHRARLELALTERAAALRIAAEARRAERAREERLAAADRTVARAVADRRELTPGEDGRITRLRSESADDVRWQHGITSAATRDSVLTALGTVRLREARAQLRDGLLQTAQMRGIIAEAMPSLRRGEPLLLVGETGGAKTALAEHLCRVVGADPRAEPELISGYGDITSAQLIGSHELRAEGGATVSVFVPGPLLRAMTEGRPVILDEVNAMPPEFLKRLNRILQLRPGDTLNVQENAGRAVRVAQGFAILATANEQTPHRYRGLDRLSAELVNRFGANSYRVHYPDTGRDYSEFPTENALLAAAAVVDHRGELPPGISVDELQRVARAAFISQQVFAGAHGEGFESYVSTEREIDGRPGLEESVLAPRTLVAILQKVAGSAGTVTLEHALTRFVEGVMHREDRRVLALILEGQGLRLG
ncbi:AAA family ATPase [Leucobacter insecticola]|uniref:AAA family ATPase n=1 Tax=Leucobacter insecticola TaxID=2714934 RepID=A0A6G8FJI7_9MICO|nr:AAA family ATPase [Leucobacter insecticola]QIM16616.1 AAA family ATPase [Leucobacter insecticola]